MGIEERTGVRDLLFSKWVRDFLPQNLFGVTDIDFCLFNHKTKNFMVLEIKCRMAKPSESQERSLEMINQLVRTGMAYTTQYANWKYMGLHFITFETEPFAEGRIYLDGEEIKESELIEYLSMN